MPSVDKKILFACLGLVFGMMIWAGNNVIARALADDIAPISLSFWRWFTAVVFLLPFSYRYLRRERAVIENNLKPLFMMSVLGVVGFNTLIYTAAHTTTAMNISLIVQLGPAITLMLAWPVLKQRPGGVQILAVAVALIGVLIIVSRGSVAALNALSFTPGDVTMLWAIAVLCLYTVLIKYYSLALHPITLITVVATIGAAILLPFYLLERSFYGDFQLTRPIIGAILYTGILASAVSNTLFNHGIGMIGPTATNMFMYLQPVFTFVIAKAVLDEPITSYHIAGGLLIILGVSVATLYQTRRTA